MRGLVTAVRCLTIVPLPGRGRDVPPGAGAAWFPVVGAALGLVLIGVNRLSSAWFDPLLAALLTVTVWKLLTGGLHLDGLADCLDGLAGRDVEQRLQIMRDSRIGTFGAMGLILLLLLDIGLLAGVPVGPRGRVLFAAPAVARAMPVLLARLFPPARPSGQAVAFQASLRRAAPTIALALGFAASVGALGRAGIVAFAVALMTALALGRFLSARLGGITGDVLGAAVEFTELVVLLTTAIWVRAPR